MQRIQVKPNPSSTTKERKRLARMGLQLAELVEDFVESTADYQPSFLRDLNQSIHEATNKKGQRITSLSDLA